MKLEEHPFVSKLEEQNLHALTDSANIVNYNCGDTVVNEGDPSDSICLVLSGKVNFFKQMHDGTKRLISACTTGGVFGEVGVFTEQPRALSALTAEDGTEIAHISGDAIKAFITNTTGPVESVLQSIINHLHYTTNHYVDDILQQEKMSALGTMVNQILHDFNNPFATIKTAAELIERESNSKYIDKMTKVIEEQIDRAVEMGKDLMDFARGKNSITRLSISTPALIETLRESSPLIFDKDNDIIKIVVDEFDLNIDLSKTIRVLQNLLTNAVESGATKISLTISGGDPAVIKVSDNGDGIPEHIRDTLFEPFVTTGKERGTGLGTAIIKSIVEAHSGNISFETETGKGTTFTVSLPLTVEE